MEVMGIDNTLETIDDLKNVLVSGVELAKNAKNPLKAVTALAKIIDDGIDLASEATATLPELCDLDEAEASQLGAASYKVIIALIAALKA